jgi:hypothetical protein
MSRAANAVALGLAHIYRSPHLPLGARHTETDAKLTVAGGPLMLLRAILQRALAVPGSSARSMATAACLTAETASRAALCRQHSNIVWRAAAFFARLAVVADIAQAGATIQHRALPVGSTAHSAACIQVLRVAHHAVRNKILLRTATLFAALAYEAQLAHAAPAARCSRTCAVSSTAQIITVAGVSSIGKRDSPGDLARRTCVYTYGA